VGSVLGVVAAPEFRWSIRKSPLIILFLNEIGFVETTLVTFRVPVFDLVETMFDDDTRYEVKTVLETFRSVNAPVPTGYEIPGKGLPEREKLIPIRFAQIL
jgi:hypothetical protein